jgi:predicted transcriptional regulator
MAIVYSEPVRQVNMKALTRSAVSKYTRAMLVDEIRSGRAVPTNFTQKQLADLFGVSQAYVSYVHKYEHRYD